jgi:hypothetical protein
MRDAKGEVVWRVIQALNKRGGDASGLSTGTSTEE